MNENDFMKICRLCDSNYPVVRSISDIQAIGRGLRQKKDVRAIVVVEKYQEDEENGLQQPSVVLE